MLLYFVHFVKQYTNEHVSLKCLCRRHSHSSIVSKNISLMNIHVNNDFKSRAAGTMGGKARTLILSALQMLSFVTLKHRYGYKSSPVCTDFMLGACVQCATCRLKSAYLNEFE